MSSVLYYSNYCQNSKELLQILSKTKLKEDIHYFCIDNRVRKPNGMIYIVLTNNQEIILPPNVTKVPSLILINKNHQVVTGKDNILSHLRPQEQVINQVATNFNGEPMAFSFGSGMSNIVSDNYSFLDMDSESLSAKGSGGIRQMHNYVSLENANNLSMHLPQDDHDYKSDKLKDSELNIESLQKKREQELTSYK